MLISRHDAIELLLQRNEDKETNNLLQYLMENPKHTINNDICKYFINHNIDIPTISHYKLLNSKAHKVIKEILECEGKDVATYIKIATSLITQATITLEHQFNDKTEQNILLANKFIEGTMLSELSQALYIYFNYNNYSELVSVIQEIRKDIKLIID